MRKIFRSEAKGRGLGVGRPWLKGELSVLNKDVGTTLIDHRTSVEHYRKVSTEGFIQPNCGILHPPGAKKVRDLIKESTQEYKTGERF